MLFILILQMYKLRLGFHRGLIAQVSSLKMKMAEFGPSDSLFLSVFVDVFVDFFIRLGIFLLCFCFAVLVGD